MKGWKVPTTHSMLLGKDVSAFNTSSFTKQQPLST